MCLYRLSEGCWVIWGILQVIWQSVECHQTSQVLRHRRMVSWWRAAEHRCQYVATWATGNGQVHWRLAEQTPVYQHAQLVIDSLGDVKLSEWIVNSFIRCFWKCFRPMLQVFPALPVKNLRSLEKCGHRLVPGSKDNSLCPVLTPAMKGNVEFLFSYK